MNFMNLVVFIRKVNKLEHLVSTLRLYNDVITEIKNIGEWFV